MVTAGPEQPGNWGWLGIIVALQVFNSVLGEDLLFRGLVLPWMPRARAVRDPAGFRGRLRAVGG